VAAYIAKAITAFVLTLLVYLIGDVNAVESLADEVEAIVAAILTGLGVYAVPNAYRGRPAPRQVP
jgi:chromate transport protein ChrA